MPRASYHQKHSLHATTKQSARPLSNTLRGCGRNFKHRIRAFTLGEILVGGTCWMDQLPDGVSFSDRTAPGAPPYTTVSAPIISTLLSQCFCELLRPVENPWKPMVPVLNPGHSPLLAKFQRPKPTGLVQSPVTASLRVSSHRNTADCYVCCTSGDGSLYLTV
eukprot:scaffold10872_cov66-Cyclotella_meneghiniana.AAC.2